MNPYVMLAMAALGGLMGKAKNDRAQQVEDADRKLASETSRYSWVTGMNPGQIRPAGSTLGDIGQGALSGAMFGSQFGGGNSQGSPNGGLSGEGNYQNQDYYQQLSNMNKAKPAAQWNGQWNS